MTEFWKETEKFRDKKFGKATDEKEVVEDAKFHCYDIIEGITKDGKFGYKYSERI